MKKTEIKNKILDLDRVGEKLKKLKKIKKKDCPLSWSV